MRQSCFFVVRLLFAALALFVFDEARSLLADEPKPAIPDAVVEAFKQAKRNGDHTLSVDEFIAGRGDVNVAKRDFKLYDFDEDGQLSLEEFACVRTEPRFDQPGVLPDFLPRYVDAAVAALDKAFGDWDQNPKREVGAAVFLSAFQLDLQRAGNNNFRADVREADPNQDQKVSRAEARRFVEIQLGVRRGDGKLLRFPNGNVANYAVFLHADADRNDVLDRTEFIERTYGGEQVAEEFDRLNLDGDAVISFDEFCRLPWRGFADPVFEFRELDANLDARVDPQEMSVRAPDWQRPLAQHMFPGFDLNQDGVLSLAEYQLTPIANKIQPWAVVLGDLDGDDVLSFAEFKIDPMRFQLLWMLYFGRLDVNGDKKLSHDEYVFKAKMSLEFFSLNEDGSDWQPFFKFEGRPNIGDPAVSPDGKSLAFQSYLQNDVRTNKVFVMDMLDRKPREVCVGMMPTWSPDGKRLACSRTATNETAYGIWTIGTDGQHAQHLQRGWGAQWSPDGKRIAFYGGLQISAYNLETKEIEVLLRANENPYQQIFWNMAWSPDSKRLSLRGLKADSTQEMAVFDPAATPKLKTRASSKVHIAEDSAWHPGGE